MSWITNNEWLIKRDREPVHWRPLLRFLRGYRPYRAQLAFAASVSVLTSLTTIAIPVSLQRMQAAIAVREQRRLLLAAALFMGILIAQNLCTWVIKRTRARIAANLNKRLLLQYFEQVLNIRTEDFIYFRTHNNMFQRVIDALSVTALATESLVQGLQEVVTIGVLLVVIIYTLPVAGIVISGTCIIIFGVALLNARRLQRARRAVLAINYPLVALMLEVIDAALIIKTLAATVAVATDVSDKVAEKEHVDVNEVNTEALSTAATSFVGNIAVATVVTLVALSLEQRQIQISQALAVYILSGLTIPLVVALANNAQGLPALSLTLKNFFETLDLPSDLNLPAQDETIVGQAAMCSSPMSEPTPRAFTGAIRFNAVSFAYRGAGKSISDLTLAIEPGQHIGIIGKSGAGKTTLFRLLLGLLTPASGDIWSSGISALYEDRAIYRNQFGVVSQTDFVFNTTIEENLFFGVPLSVRQKADPLGILERVGLRSKIEGLPDSIHSRYYQDTFSGGERQRLLIARALLRDPAVVLLDEPTSALDFESEALVLKALNELTAGRTTLTIAHRLTTVRAADRILVMDAGSIVADGSHMDLIETSAYYRSLCEFNSFLM